MKTIYVYEAGAVLKKSGQRLSVQKEGIQLYSEPLIGINSVVLFEYSQITGQLMAALLEHGITVVYSKKSGKILGSILPSRDNNVFLRIAQYDSWKDEKRRLSLAKCFVAGKIASQKIAIKKYRSRDFILCNEITDALIRFEEQLIHAQNVYEVMGIEGASTHCYYGLLKRFFIGMPFTKRSKHPPCDEVNSLLSLSYMMMFSRLQTALMAKGFDTSIGYLHSIQANRDSLGLDMMEVFRSKLDNMVMTWVNRREFTQKDFEMTQNDGFVLHKDGFRRFVGKFNAADVMECIPPYVNWLYKAMMSGEDVSPWHIE